MQNILTNLVRVQHERYGSDREAFSLVDVAGKKCISTTWGEFSPRCRQYGLCP